MTIALLIVGSIYLLVTGLIMDKMGLHNLAFHGAVGYGWVALAVVHFILSGKQLLAYWGHRFGHHPHRHLPGQQSERQERVDSERLPGGGRRSWFVSVLTAAGGFILARLLAGFQRGEVPEEIEDVGLFYHQWSRIGIGRELANLFNPGEEPERYKTYLQAEKFDLPSPPIDQGLSLAKTIETRRSKRDYLNKPISLVNLSQLLYLGLGITNSHRELRSAPSAGALYPLEVYPVVYRVEGLPEGIYHYDIRNHKLEQLKAGDFRVKVVAGGLGQNFLGQGSICFILSGIWQRTRWKYGPRTYRYVLMEAGHVGQNLYLAATSLGLGACAVGAFFDDALNNLLELDGISEAVLYLVSVGQITSVRR